MSRFNYQYQCAALVSLFVLSSESFAQAEFADDFSVDTIKYGYQSRAGDGDVASVEAQSGYLLMSADSLSGSRSENELLLGGTVNDISITGQFDVGGTSAADGTWAYVSVQSTLFNDTTSDGSSRLGDLYFNVSTSVFTDGSTNLLACMGREGENGYEEYPLAADGNSCVNIGVTSPALGDEFELGLSVTGSNEVTFTAAGQTEVITIPGALYEPYARSTLIKSGVSGGVSESEFQLKTVTVNGATDDFAVSQAVVGRYRIYSNNSSAAEYGVVDERVSLSTLADGGDGELELNFNDRSDYIEAVLEFSSQTDVSQKGSRVQAELMLETVNDIADGGTDGRTGNIRAQILLDARHNGLRRVEYCLVRYTDAQGNNRDRLLNDGSSSCREFPVKVAFDTPYRAAINIDRASGDVTFRFDGFTRSESLGQAVFGAFEPRQYVRMDSREGGRLLGYIDDVRNSPTALTAAEQAAGQATPTAFPAEPDAASLAVDSTLAVPRSFSTAPATFVDDFSSDTSAIGIEQWQETNSSIFYAGGALALQANSQRDPQEGSGGTAFNLNQATDSVMINAAVSSNSRVPAGDRTNVVMRLRTVMLNDTVDGGLAEGEGDIEASIQVYFQGNGRAQVQAEVRRRNATGGTDRQAVFPDGNNRYYFEDFVPQFDTPYDMGIRIDRSVPALIFSFHTFDDVSVPLSQVFTPSQRRVQITSEHQGTSGRSDVRLYSLVTDNDSFDFSMSPPVIGPYRPAYNAERPGTSIDVEAGRLRLETDGRVEGSRRNSQLRVRGVSEHVGADIELSSESEVGAMGYAFIGVSGVFYTDLDNGDENREGTVFAALRLNSTGAEGNYVEYCAFRSADESFNSDTELLGGDSENCPRFSVVPDLDTPYAASITLDKTAKTLTYKFDTEEFVYNIPTDIFDDARHFNGVRVRVSDDSRGVGYADNLAFSATPTPLAQSDDNFSNVVAATGGGTTGDTTGGTTGSTSGGSSGGGGCSIGAGDNRSLAFLLLAAMIMLVYRRRRD